MNLLKWWKRKKTPQVIQIGVGGYAGCGKTVLIDAIFATLDKQNYPGYLPSGFINDITIDCSGDIFEGKFKKYSELRNYVSSYFHQSKETPVEEGKFNSNTYWMKLKYKRKKFILLIRNLPGEMFNQYFSDSYLSNLNGKSLNSAFNDFITQNKEYRNKYKHFFNGNKSGEEISKFKIKFEEYLKTEYKEIEKNDSLSLCMDDFYAYVFYKSSNTIIRCVKAYTENETEIKVNNDMLEKTDEMFNDFICITQFDRIMKVKYPFQFKISENTWETYATRMSEIYNDIEKKEYNIVDEEKLEASKPQNIFQTTPYFSSVAFRFDKDEFLGFENDSDLSFKQWNLRNNQYRTSLGVIELVSNILKKNNIELSIGDLDPNIPYLNGFLDRL